MRDVEVLDIAEYALVDAGSRYPAAERRPPNSACALRLRRRRAASPVNAGVSPRSARRGNEIQARDALSDPFSGPD